MVEKRQYETIKEFAKDYRTEIIPMMKSKGFTLSINTSKGSYWNDGRISFVIKKVPNNFYVWTNEYSRYNKTEKSNKLLNTIAIVVFLLFVVAPPIFGDELTHRFKK